eukprot:comp8706_c0_seq1/m.3960 comp8706_c0_seq1/g.3960  ORF comp8706_c0_seq1/g.3960 comp8706_c0_seq1/m.3960 type:complete len:102 (-) comp8706_c0_seq1:317-622(-)
MSKQQQEKKTSASEAPDRYPTGGFLPKQMTAEEALRRNVGEKFVVEKDTPEDADPSEVKATRAADSEFVGEMKGMKPKKPVTVAEKFGSGGGQKEEEEEEE